VTFVVDTVALGQVFLRGLRFPLSEPFHQCSLSIFSLTLLLWEEKVDSLFWTIGNNEQHFHTFILVFKGFILF